MARIRELVVRSVYGYVLPILVWALYKTISSTWRVTIYEPPSLQGFLQRKAPVIFAHWHGDEIAMLSLIRRYRVATIVSTSVDGDMMARLVRLVGGATVRGSSTRGAVAALKGLLRLVRADRRNSSFAVDGPKGPIHKVKPGVFEVSRLMSAPIYAAGVSCDRAWVFPKSWNKTYFPKPFAKIHFEWLEPPLGPIRRDQNSADPELAKTLEEALHCAGSLAQKKNFAQ